ncbi:NAD(P)/FAD-dependent oxidoreductase [Luteipulveratus sp. YIM 133132]|uniref:flavin-containing monooxygenase n=1 Tax=Luteipulveratus flavus TaxID=3031728 RepID=UPI0023AEE6A9|nr:NAD(P)/FAD-dependent oxidoreductase [Luteipulveratus sp. YIM 133132]MDE9366621.1 NAD(P)/FAD-dependent oxidoreductase [Luteipulveratus sp. YIM 133132]
MDSAHYDVVIVGAGISGIGAAYRLQTECPGLSYLIVEGRGSVGGTWDLFKYPGLRSDSDMFTLGFPFEPWRGEKSIADGADILQYIKDTTAKYGIDERIRLNTKVTHASWSSEDASWTIDLAGGDGPSQVTAGFCYLASGYYSYDEGYTPDFPGRESFTGQVVHPQFWPEDLDVTGKRVVVIGSGATAITLVPALADRGAEHVTMLQRTPSYILALPGKDPVADLVRRLPSDKVAHSVNRWSNAVKAVGFYQFARRMPGIATKALTGGARRALVDAPAYDPKHFQPPYKPWDQRVCFIPDGDLFTALRSGDASIVTDTIDAFVPEGIRTSSGEVVQADIVVTATGLNLQIGGGATLDVDGEKVDFGDHFVYRGCMLEGVPNAAMAIGYTNASWTLRADLSAQFFCRFVRQVRDNGYAFGFPRVSGSLTPSPVLDLSSGYVQRSVEELPRRGDKAPWLVRQNYVLDALDMKRAKPTDDMRFVRPGESIRPGAGTARRTRDTAPA